MTTIGITGHQRIPTVARDYVIEGIRRALRELTPPLLGFTSLAAGADQFFAREIIAAGGTLGAIIPSRGYDTTFSADDLVEYENLLAQCSSIEVLDFAEPSEAAFMAAGEAVVSRCQVVLAVWDGLPAAGLGGTADAVARARELGRTVIVIWPAGVTR